MGCIWKFAVMWQNVVSAMKEGIPHMMVTLLPHGGQALPTFFSLPSG